jgi:hypothetical protein
MIPSHHPPASGGASDPRCRIGALIAGADEEEAAGGDAQVGGEILAGHERFGFGYSIRTGSLPNDRRQVGIVDDGGGPL